MNNSDIAIWLSVTNQFNYLERPLLSSVAEANTFVSCYFDCEIAVACADYLDELGVPSGGIDTLANGSIPVVDFIFTSCDFDSNTESGAYNGFFYSARHAADNVFVNCGVYGFNRYVIQNSQWAVNNSYVPIWTDPVVEEYVDGFDFVGCDFDNPDLNPGEEFPFYPGNTYHQ